MLVYISVIISNYFSIRPEKMKSMRLCLFLYICTSLIIHTTQAAHYQPKNSNADTVQLFSIVRTELRKPEYAQDVLPNDFSYLNQLLRYGQGMHNRQEYARCVFGIFSKVMGASQYVNAYSFSHLVEELPQTLNPYFVNYKLRGSHRSAIGLDGDMFDRFKESVTNTLYTQFSSQYESFKSSPSQFFDELSDSIVELAKQEIDAQQMRSATKRFLELGISKLVWSPEEHTKIWGNVKNIAQNLSLLMENAIVEDSNDLDDMYWTLIHRFNYFLDLMGTHIPSSFYQEVREDIASNNLLLLNLAEQDVCIQTKKECLQYALLEAEARSRAYEKGILTS